jgi:UDP-N-acetyl-D-mannosaminuronic acid dehydrogenase
LPSVCVVGTGYVGLPLCIMLARSGHSVLGVDVQERVVAGINSGEFPFEEADLAAAFHAPEVRTNLRASLAPAPADIFVVAVPTPVDHRKRVADLSYVEAAVASILPHLQPGNLIIIESTIPPLTCRETVAPAIERHGLKVGEDVLLAHCPERILPGDILREIVDNDRIIGGTTPEATARARAMYASFVQGELLETDDVTAELCKLMENTYRDVNVALANEFAAVSETLGVDVLRAIALANRHPRVDILKPGIGTGGHCIPVDPWFIRQVDPDNARLIDAARRVNGEVPGRIAAKVRRAVAGLVAPRIAVIGVTYKPNAADCRESPAIEIVDHLRADGYALEVYDPLAAGYAWPGSVLDAARGMDCLVILVEHNIVRRELAEHEPAIRAAMRNPEIMRFYHAAVEQPTQREVATALLASVGD